MHFDTKLVPSSGHNKDLYTIENIYTKKGGQLLKRGQGSEMSEHLNIFGKIWVLGLKDNF